MGDHRSSSRVAALRRLLALIFAALLLAKLVMHVPLHWWAVLAPVWLPLLAAVLVRLPPLRHQVTARASRVVLRAFLDAGPDRQLYGDEIMHAAGLVSSATLYPILDRFEDAGWIEGQWAAPERPGHHARRRYRLTGAGLAAARRAGAGGVDA